METLFLSGLKSSELRELIKNTDKSDPLHALAKHECLRRADGCNMIANYAGMGIIVCILVLILFTAVSQ